MSNCPEWLPALVRLEDYSGDWDAFLNAVYGFFKQDFVDMRPVFRGRRLGLKRHPVSEGKEATFWHMTSEGKVESERTPDLRRCEKIRWPRPMIEHADEYGLKVWSSIKRNETRIHIWLESEDYLVVLADRKGYLLPWTAFLVTRDHTKQKLRKEYEAYQKTQAKNG